MVLPTSDSTPASPLDYLSFVSTGKGLHEIFAKKVPSTEESSVPKAHTYKVIKPEEEPAVKLTKTPPEEKVSFPLDPSDLALIQEIESLADPDIKKLIDEMKELSQNEFKKTHTDIKELKGKWEGWHNAILYEQEIRTALGQPFDTNLPKLLSIVDRQLGKASETAAALKKEKHELEAGSLKQVRTIAAVFPLAVKGDEKAVKAFVKLGQEAQSIQRIRQGPVPESKEAKTMSTILSTLQKELSITFNTETKKCVVKNKEIVLCDDLQKLLLDVDWSQVGLKD